ncbi:MAG TPA: NIF family HAD-type phosphatase, partial [Candidatus Melainabacteria bacterium]|nr:NIF family HAD-type phosphatase [Candidatus Melainabacteria bacterium]
TELYVMELLAHIAPKIEFEFVFGRNRCTRRFDPERKDHFFLKDLKKVKERGFDLDRVLILEDEPRKVSRHYGNVVYVRPYYGERSDEELLKLARYLLSIKDETNLRSIDKRLWHKGL